MWKVAKSGLVSNIVSTGECLASVDNIIPPESSYMGITNNNGACSNKGATDYFDKSVMNNSVS